jgi:plasmid stabilization system protein ParE
MLVRPDLKYTRKANRDLEGIADYLEGEAGELVALRMLDAVDRTVELIRMTPEIGMACHLSSGRDPRLRRLQIYSHSTNRQCFIRHQMARYGFTESSTRRRI